MASLLLTLLLCSAGSLLTDLLLARFDLLFAYLLRPGLLRSDFVRILLLMSPLNFAFPRQSLSSTRQTVYWNISLGDSPLCALSTACDIISSPAQHYGALQGDLQAEKGERNYYFPGLVLSTLNFKQNSL